MTYQQPHYQPPPPKRSSVTWWIIGGCGVILVLTALCACGFFVLGGAALISTETPAPAPAVAEPATVQPSAVPSEPTDIPTPLPTDTPKPAPTDTLVPTPVEALPEVQSYGLEVAAKAQTLGEALVDLGELLQNPRLADDDWTLAVALQITIVRLTHEELTEMDVPPEMTEIHNALLDATGDFYASMDYVTSGIDNLNPADLETATELMDSGNEKIAKATRMLEEYMGGSPMPTVELAPPTPSLPTAAPMPGPSQLEVLSHKNYVDDIGWYHIVGEVRNSSDSSMGFVKVVATLHDDAGNVTGTSFTYTELDVIPPGGKSPFDLATEKWEGTTNYKLQVQGDSAGPPRQDMVILSHSQHVDDIDFLHVQGEVQNQGDTPAEFVKVVVTLYDATGGVVGTTFTYTELDTVPPGGTSPFDAATQQPEGFDHYEIQVQAQ